MAAELVLTFAVEESLKKLGSIATDVISRAFGLKRDLKKLGATTRMIQEVLQDAEEKQARDVRVKEWLEKLQDIVYSAGDVLDEFSYETLRRQVEVQGQHKLKAREFVSHKNPILFSLKMANKVKKINESLADIERVSSRELTLRGITRVDREVNINGQFLDRKTDSFLGSSERPIGRTADVKRIIDILQAGSPNPPFLTFIYIVGIGGIGKTTLAKLVLKEVNEKKLYDEMMWVCVSDAFDYQRVLLEMLQKLDKSTGALGGDDAIIHHLVQLLKNKKFLLVLDDVWNDEAAKWNGLIERLKKISKKDGNFVIVTTRKNSVAEVMNTTPKHLVHLEELSKGVCWSIIKNKFLEVCRESVPEELEPIGTKIAEKCGGVPLAAQVLGGTLCSSKDKEFWLSIEKNTLEAIGGDNEIFPILKLSFDHLSPPLKQCFAYCSLFPKDFVFEKKVLIQLWMAEEFLNATSTKKGACTRLMEDVGEEYFNSLLANSFFQDVQVDVWGNINAFKMHDLLHDLAKSVSNTQSLPPGSNCIFKTSDGRRLNFDYDQVSRFEEVLTNDDARNLRVLFSKVDISPMLYNCKSLRSLNISGAKLKEIPLVIGKLKHLRYLDISRNESILALPESITKLYNLQTLRLLECKSLKELPRNIGNLTSLRHIHFDDKSLLIFEVGRLTSLQTLPYFVVGLEEGLKICELKGLIELREVEFFNLEHVRDGKEAEEAEIEKKKLSKLALTWNKVKENEREDSFSHGGCNHGDVLTSLQPAQGLLSLIIKCFMGKEFPQWMSMNNIGSPYPLKKLVNLELKSCKKCEKMPTLGHLPHLKFLKMEGLDNIVSMSSEFDGESNEVNDLFPVLEELSMREMKSLVGWTSPVGTKSFLKLRKLFIEDCPYLTSIPLGQSTSSAIGMHIKSKTRYWVENLVGISCFLDLKSLEEVAIRKCPKLTFQHLDLTSFRDLKIRSGDFNKGKRSDISKTLSLLSNESLKAMIIVGTVEMIRAFPKSLEALEICDVNNLSADALHGLSSLKHLKIAGCHRLKSIPSLSSLISLNHLQIESCHRLESIPSLLSLISLNHLQIEWCYILKSIPSLSSLTSLNHLRIKFCDRLESIPSLSSLTSLKYLYIFHCDRLESIANLSTSLQELEILVCEKLRDLPPDSLSALTCLEALSLRSLNISSLPNGIKSCHSLKKLSILSCEKLSDLSPISFSTLTSLEKLRISFCPRLRSLPAEIKLCTSLKELKVHYCRGLVNIDDDMIGSLSQLKELGWGCFSDELDEFPGLNSIHLLTSLQKIEISGWNKLTSLPHQLQHLTSISELKICHFKGVESLPDWLCNLSSLQTLSISFCDNLKNLPTTLQCLSKLTRLQIDGCSHLRQRCAKDIGPEWPNICHIPHICFSYGY